MPRLRGTESPSRLISWKTSPVFPPGNKGAKSGGEKSIKKSVGGINFHHGVPIRLPVSPVGREGVNSSPRAAGRMCSQGGASESVCRGVNGAGKVLEMLP